MKKFELNGGATRTHNSYYIGENAASSARSQRRHPTDLSTAFCSGGLTPLRSPHAARRCLYFREQTDDRKLAAAETCVPFRLNAFIVHRVQTNRTRRVAHAERYSVAAPERIEEELPIGAHIHAASGGHLLSRFRAEVISCLHSGV